MDIAKTGRGRKHDVAQSGIVWKVGGGQAVVFKESDEGCDTYFWLSNHTDVRNIEYLLREARVPVRC
jgi:hypothetical protein